MTEGDAPDSPTLADQVSKLFDLVAGYSTTISSRSPGSSAC